MAHVDNDLPDAAIRGLLGRLAGFLADVDGILAGEAVGSVAGDELLPAPGSPLVLLLRLRTEAMHNFHGLLRLIEDPVATPVAPTVVRSLLECWAHVLWIAEGVPGTSSSPTTPEGRALCLELGMAKFYATNLQRASDQAQPPGAASAATAWHTKVTREHAATGCSCSGRTYRDVQATLRYLRDTHGVDWPLDTWIAASAAGHALMPHRLANALGDSTVWGGPSTPLERQKWLERGTVSLINVYLYVIGTLRPGVVRAFDSRAHQALTDVKSVNATIMAADARGRSTSTMSARAGTEADDIRASEGPR